MSEAAKQRLRVLAVSSGGGHWIELLRAMPAFDACDVVFVTVNRDYAKSVPGHRVHVVNDATRWSRISLIRMALTMLWILIRERPEIIMTTGAAPGYCAIRLGRWLGARTIWLDSIANVDELSLSGQLAGGVANLWLTQWPHLSDRGPSHSQARRPRFAGTVLG